MPDAQQTIPMWLKTVVGVVVFGIMVWGIAYVVGRNTTAHAEIVSSHETRITKTENAVTALDARLDSTEKMQISLAKDQAAILNGQRDLKSQQGEMNKLILRLIESNAETKAWIKSIDNVKEE